MDYKVTATYNYNNILDPQVDVSRPQADIQNRLAQLQNGYTIGDLSQDEFTQYTGVVLSIADNAGLDTSGFSASSIFPSPSQANAAPNQVWSDPVVSAPADPALDLDAIVNAPLDTAGTYQEGRVVDIMNRLRLLQKELIAGRLTAATYPQYGFPLSLKAAEITNQIASSGSTAANSVNNYWGEIQYEGFITGINGQWVPQVPPLIIRQNPIVFPKPNKNQNFFKQAESAAVSVAKDVAIVASPLVAPAIAIFPKKAQSTLGLSDSQVKLGKIVGVGEIVGAVVGTGVIAAGAIGAGTAATGGGASAAAIFGKGASQAVQGIINKYTGAAQRPANQQAANKTGPSMGFFATLFHNIIVFVESLFGSAPTQPPANP